MEFFAKVFDALASVASRLPKIDVGTYFIIMAVALVVIGIIIGLTYFSSAAGKMKRATKKVLVYLESTSEINDENAADFTNDCFGSSTPRLLREAWVKYLGVRFGYPTEIVTEKGVFDAEVKKFSNARSNIFIAIALILIGVLAFWGLGTNGSASIGVIIGVGLILSGVVYLVLVALGKKQYNKAREVFYAMQDELDAKVDFHVEKDYSTDASPLLEMTSIIDEIIGRNTAKVVELPTEVHESDAPEKIEEPVEEEIEAEAPVEESAEKVVEEEADEIEKVEEIPSEELESEIVEEVITATAEDVESDGSDEVQETESDVVELTEIVDTTEQDDDSSAEDEESLDTEIVAEEKDLAPRSEEMTDADAIAEDSISDKSEEIAAEDIVLEQKIDSEEEADAEEKSVGDVPVDVLVDAAEEEIPFVPIVFPENKKAQQEEDIEDIANLEIGTATMTKNKPVRNIFKDEGVGDWLAGQNEFGLAAPVEAFEEVNIEDEEVMFGKKKKEAAAATAAQQTTPAAEANVVKPTKVYADSEVFVESELVPEVDQAAADKVAETATVSAPAPAETEQERPDFKRTLVTAAPVVELEPEVIEEMEDLDEGDEDIKAPRLSKLPHLVDYILSTNVSRMTKIKVAQLMFQAFAVFKNSPENKAIVVQCLMKVMESLKSAE